VLRLAETVVRLAKNVALPPIDTPAWTLIPSAFRDLGPTRRDGSVRIVLAAAIKDQPQDAVWNTLRLTSQARDWRPFGGRGVVELIDSVAMREAFAYEELPFSDELVKAIRDLEDTATPVIVIFDGGTLENHDYRSILAQLDNYSLTNVRLVAIAYDANFDIGIIPTLFDNLMKRDREAVRVAFGEDDFEQCLANNVAALKSNLLSRAMTERDARINPEPLIADRHV